MPTSVIILTIIYIIFLLYVYLRYNLDPKDSSQYDKMYREKLDISASEAAYLIDKNSNGLNLILADILNLIPKNFVTMEITNEGEKKDYIFRKKENQDYTNLKAHEMSSYRLFFGNNDKMTIKQYIDNIKKDENYIKELELKNVSIKNDLEFELRKIGITDVKAEKKLLRFNKFSISLIIVFIIAFIISLFTINSEYIEFSCIGLLFSVLLYRITALKEDKLTKYGIETKKKALGFKRFLQTYVISSDKPLYMVNVLDYNYIMAVAYGLAKLGEDEFVKNTYNAIQIKKIISAIIDLIIIIGIIAYEIFI